MKTSEFFYQLPPELIAQKPVSPRDHSRLLVINSKCKIQNAKLRDNSASCILNSEFVQHHHFYDLPNYLRRGDVLVFNDTKVFPARLYGHKTNLPGRVPAQAGKGGGGKIEILLLERKNENTWTALLKPGRNAVGQAIDFGHRLIAQVAGRQEEIFTLKFNQSGLSLDRLIDRLGSAPTPPYIKPRSDLKEYQTVYAKHRGSAAAPTAGFHFTPELLAQLKERGIQFEYVTLHVGLGTFQPVKEEEIERHRIHTEKYSVTPETWQRLLAGKKSGRRIIAVGTTTARVLETLGAIEAGAALRPHLPRPPLKGNTNIFIKPGYHFKMIDGLITNFHLPESTLLMLVAAFIGDQIKNPAMGINLTKEIYKTAIKEKYRFYSFGDAMLII